MVRRPMILAALVALVAVGCGGSGMSLEDYFARLKAIQEPFEKAASERSDELDASLQSATSETEGLAALRAFLEESRAATEELIADLEAMDPPAEAEGRHDDLIAAARASVDGVSGLIDRYDEFQSVDEVGQFFTTELADVEQRGDEACNALQTLADDNGIDVDLSCDSSPPASTPSPSVDGSPEDEVPPSFEVFSATAEGFTIAYPSDWTKTKGAFDSVVLFQSPSEGASDAFLENISVTTEALGKTGIGLEEYTKAGKMQIGQFITRLDIVEEGAATLAGLPAYRIHYTGTQGVFELEFLQVWTVSKGVAFVVTYVAQVGHYESSLGAAQEMIASFSLTSWTGTTSQGKPISFTVSDDVVTSIAIKWRHGGASCPLLDSSIEVSSLDIPIVDGVFTIQDPSIMGTFESDTTASGTARFTTNKAGCKTASVTWKAKK